MTASRWALSGLRALLAMALAFVAVVLANWIGSWIATLTEMPPGGDARLSWDLGWLAAAGILGAWVVVRAAPCRPRAHAAAFFIVALALGGVAVAQAGCDFPLWFRAGILLGLPFQVWLGAWWALRGRRAWRE